MKYSELRFEMPVRLFHDEDDEDKIMKQLDNGEMPEYVIGYQRHFIEDIRSWGDAYTAVRTPESVKKKGFDSTRVDLVDGDTFICSWKRSKFEEKYDEHMGRLKEHNKSLEEMIEERAWELVEEILSDEENNNTELK